tara:strand:+ start:492 stop:686 length:195 start_codon:yes stop_codon:yes gene_type:complete
MQVGDLVKFHEDMVKVIGSDIALLYKRGLVVAKSDFGGSVWVMWQDGNRQSLPQCNLEVVSSCK